MDVFARMYEPYQSELAAFGDAWCMKSTTLKHCEDVLVAFYQKERNGDGRSVEVYCCALPARFYTIKAMPSVDSAGEELKPFEMSTGSGMARLAADIADAISKGMLGLRRDGAA